MSSKWILPESALDTALTHHSVARDLYLFDTKGKMPEIAQTVGKRFRYR